MRSSHVCVSNSMVSISMVRRIFTFCAVDEPVDDVCCTLRKVVAVTRSPLPRRLYTCLRTRRGEAAKRNRQRDQRANTFAPRGVAGRRSRPRAPLSQPRMCACAVVRTTCPPPPAASDAPSLQQWKQRQKRRSQLSTAEFADRWPSAGPEQHITTLLYKCQPPQHRASSLSSQRSGPDPCRLC